MIIRINRFCICISLILYFNIFVPFDSQAESLKEQKYYTIMVDNNKEFSEIKKIISKYNSKVVYEVQELYILQIKGSESDVQKIKKKFKIFINKSTSSSKRTNPNSKITKLDEDDIKNKQWDVIKTTNNFTSYSKNKGSHLHAVALIDSGIDIRHPDLKMNILSYKNLVPKNGFRSEEKDENGKLNYIVDKIDHGTQVAGQIASNGNIKSIAPETGLKVYRVIGSKSAENIWILKGIVEAANDDVDVINLSLGDYLMNSPFYSQGRIQTNDAVEYHGFIKAVNYAHRKGSIVVGALGNDSINIDDNEKFLEKVFSIEPYQLLKSNTKIYDFPAQQKNVIGVGSADFEDQIADYSNTSEAFLDVLSYSGDYGLLTTYGQDIWQKDRLFEKDLVITTSQNESGYTYTTGNSIAAGKVSTALAALNNCYNIKNDPRLTQKILKNRLHNSKILNMNEILGNSCSIKK